MRPPLLLLALSAAPLSAATATPSAATAAPNTATAAPSPRSPDPSATSSPAPTPPSTAPTAPRPHSPDSSATSPAPARITAALLTCAGVDPRALADALATRLPALALVDAFAPASGPEAGLSAVLDVRPAATPGAFALRVVLADGRAYVREVEADPPAAPRALAGALASLLPAIEEAAVPADEVDAPLPEPLAALARAEAASPPEPPPPASAPPPPPEPPADPPADPSIAPPPPSAPRLELGPLTAFTGLIGVGPAAAGWRGAGLHLGLDLRLRAGLTLGLDLRHATWAVDRYRLGRLRVALALGVAPRLGALEAPLLALLAVEPWWLRSAGAPLPVEHQDGGGPRPLLGLGLRLAPGYRAALGPGDRLHLRLGARLEAALSGEPRAGLRVPTLGLAGAPPLIALGGLELSAGLELALWLTPRSVAARPRPR